MCNHERKLSITAKCSDMCSLSFPGGVRQDDGYVPQGLSIGGGDYIEMDVCIDCGVVIGFPKAEDVMRIAQEMHDAQESRKLRHVKGRQW